MSDLQAVAGRVSIGRQGLWFNGGTSLVVSLVVPAMVLGWIGAPVSLALLALGSANRSAATPSISSQVSVCRPVRIK